MINQLALDYGTINVGDWIQSVAGLQFLTNVTTSIDRDYGYLGRNKNDILKNNFNHSLIYNGWINTKYSSSAHHYLQHVENLLMTSVNIQPESYSNLPDIFTKNIIGLRDLDTYTKLLEYNHRCYFSGCMTTLIKRPNNLSRIKGKIIINELDRLKYGDSPTAIGGLKSLAMNKSSAIHENPSPETLNLCYAKFPKNIVDDAIFIDHDNFDLREGNYRSAIEVAQSVLYEYATAELVITSRLHAALPCLAMGTPVVFIWHKNDSRMDGLHQLFNGFVHSTDFFSSNFVFEKISTGRNERYFEFISNSLRKRIKTFLLSTGQQYVEDDFSMVNQKISF
jgi:hypothetical protein